MPELAMLLGCLTLGMEPALMRAIVEQESAGDPAALNANGWTGTPFRPTSAEEAVEAAHRFLDAGYSVDVGLAGINSANLERLGIDLKTAFDPCTNVALGETIFMENLERARAHGHAGDAALRVGLSLYNTGSMTRGFANGYVDQVWSRYAAGDAYLGRVRSSRIEWVPVDRAAGSEAIAEPEEVVGAPRSSRVRWTGRSGTDTSAAADDAPAADRSDPNDRNDRIDQDTRTTAAASTAPPGVIGVWRSAMPKGEGDR